MLSADIIAVIPARSGSKRLPNKNLVMVNGKPLIQHTVDFINSMEELDVGLISTDSREIQLHAKGKVLAPFLRPKKFSGDNSKDKEWLKHLIIWLQTNAKLMPKHIMIMRPTSPLRSLKSVKQAIELARKFKTSVRSVTRIPKKMHPLWAIERTGCDYKPYAEDGFLTRSQDLSDTYFPNGLIDIVYVPEFLASDTLYGEKFRVVKNPIEHLNDIDTYDDLKNLENNWNEIRNGLIKFDESE